MPSLLTQFLLGLPSLTASCPLPLSLPELGVLAAALPSCMPSTQSPSNHLPEVLCHCWYSQHHPVCVCVCVCVCVWTLEWIPFKRLPWDCGYCICMPPPSLPLCPPPSPDLTFLTSAGRGHSMAHSPLLPRHHPHPLPDPTPHSPQQSPSH